jgi:ATP-binding cassette subfamily B protein
MVGHRTRLVQQSAKGRHEEEDDTLDRYVEDGAQMDSWELRLLTLVPRAWLAVAMAALGPAAVSGMPPGSLAAAVGGMLLAYRALRRLTAGISDVAGAIIASRVVAPLLRAAGRREAVASPSTVIARPPQAGDGLVAQARDLVFRYRPGTEPVLQNCTLRIHRGARLLVEGPSGSGKTTFASVLAGLQAPDSGLLLVDGLDRSVLGAAGWRSRVAMAPQSHDNYLVSGSLAFNLLMGRRWPALESDVVEAAQVCRDLGLGDLIDRMPGGLYQMVGETGWQLSQGERTRVFLARALLQRPHLLVLDESFSALDPENVDRAVRCVLQRAPTVLAIAHT